MGVVVNVCARNTSPCLSSLISAEFMVVERLGLVGGEHHAGVLPPSMCVCVCGVCVYTTECLGLNCI